MYDVNVQKEKQSFQFKEFGVNLLIALIPGMFIVTALKMIGVSGALVPMVVYLGGAVLIGRFRKKRKNRSN